MKLLIQTSRSNLLSRRRALLRLTELAAANEVVLNRLSEHDRQELLEIDAALLRMDEGTWGRCEGCGGSIGRQRLQALPEARQCLACRERAETGI